MLSIVLSTRRAVNINTQTRWVHVTHITIPIKVVFFLAAYLLFVLTNTCENEAQKHRLDLKPLWCVCMNLYFVHKTRYVCPAASGCSVSQVYGRLRVCVCVTVNTCNISVFMGKTSDYDSLWWYVLQYNLRSFTLSLDTVPYLTRSLIPPVSLTLSRSLSFYLLLSPSQSAPPASLTPSESVFRGEPYPSVARIKYPFTYSVVVYFTRGSARIAATFVAHHSASRTLAVLWRSLSSCGRRRRRCRCRWRWLFCHHRRSVLYE